MSIGDPNNASVKKKKKKKKEKRSDQRKYPARSRSRNFYDPRDKIHSTWIRESSRENDRVTRFLQKPAGYRWTVWRCKNGSAHDFSFVRLVAAQRFLSLGRVFPTLHPQRVHRCSLYDGLTHGGHDKSIFFSCCHGNSAESDPIRARSNGNRSDRRNLPLLPPLAFTHSLSLSLSRLEAEESRDGFHGGCSPSYRITINISIGNSPAIPESRWRRLPFHPVALSRSPPTRNRVYVNCLIEYETRIDLHDADWNSILSPHPSPPPYSPRNCHGQSEIQRSSGSHEPVSTSRRMTIGYDLIKKSIRDDSEREREREREKRLVRWKIE